MERLFYHRYETISYNRNKSGYYSVLNRKIAEYIYSQLIFKGLRKFYKLNYNTVSSNYYKNYLLVNYLLYAPINLKEKNGPIKKIWNNDYFELNDSEFFISILSLSKRLTFDKLDYEKIVYRYGHLI